MKFTYFFVWLCVFSVSSYGQAPSEKLRNNPYKNSQWYIEIQGGLNYSHINIINDYNIINASNSLEKNLYNKQYKSKFLLGSNFGVQTAYQFEQRLVLGGGLQLNQMIFSYNQNLPNNSNSIEFQHNHQFTYLDVPVFFRFMLRRLNSRMWNRSWRKPGVPAIIPYFQVGLNFGFLMNANKDVDRNILSDDFTITDVSFSENVSGLLNSSTFGAHLAAGARFRLGNVYLTTELNVKQTVTNLANDNTRYSNKNLVNNAYDIFDDMSSTQFSFLVGLMVPLKYLSKKEFLPVEL